MRRAYGFTIVELLIVIVVIAILATLSYVGYVNISSRANDSVIQSDLVNFAKKLQTDYYALGLPYPQGGGVKASAGASNSGAGTRFDNFKFSPSKSSYANEANLVYCTSPDASGNSAFIVRAKSKSGAIYEYNSTVGRLVVYGTGGSVPQEYAACNDLGGWPRSWSYGLYAGVWQSWTD